MKKFGETLSWWLILNVVANQELLHGGKRVFIDSEFIMLRFLTYQAHMDVVPCSGYNDSLMHLIKSHEE